jgi:beta-N-acetylhexosaminidase
MNKIVLLSLTFLAITFQNFISNSDNPPKKTIQQTNQEINQRTEKILKGLSEEEKVAQMLIVTVGEFGKPQKDVLELFKKYKIGGILLLKGKKTEFKQYVHEFNQLADEIQAVRPWFSADAEPSLINMKINGTKYCKPTSYLKDSLECVETTQKICTELLEIGIQHNFAPVCDMSYTNVAIGNRSFGADINRVFQMSNVFIQTSRNNGILPTAKHFPGHGFVKGDTHKNLVFIEGEMKEIDLYKRLIASEVPCIMVGHIAVRKNEKYDTKGLPATCSRTIVTDLLKNELGFKGLIVTDAMTMGAVKYIPKVGLKAVQAGCDLILGIENEAQFIADVTAEMLVNEAFREQVYESVHKIIRYKVALGVI